MSQKEYKAGIQAQVNEEDFRNTIKRQEKEIKRLKAQVGDLEFNINKWYEKTLELEKRAESFKSQLIVYKGLYEKVMDKLISRCNE